jgi:hypothetical protein
VTVEMDLEMSGWCGIGFHLDCEDGGETCECPCHDEELE